MASGDGVDFEDAAFIGILAADTNSQADHALWIDVGESGAEGAFVIAGEFECGGEQAAVLAVSRDEKFGRLGTGVSGMSEARGVEDEADGGFVFAFLGEALTGEQAELGFIGAGASEIQGPWVVTIAGELFPIEAPLVVLLAEDGIDLFAILAFPFPFVVKKPPTQN